MARKHPKNEEDTVIQGKTTVIEDGVFVDDDVTVEEMIEVVKTKSGALAYEESPFLRDWQLDTRKKLYTVDRGTAVLRPGEHFESRNAVTRVQQEVEVDKKTFVKIFSGEFKHVYNLTTAGLRMYMVFLDILSRSMNQIHVRCTWPIVQKLTSEGEEKFSYQTYNRGMKDLIDRGYIAGAIIAGETDGWFWINQDRFYNGNQVLLVKRIKLGNKNKTENAGVERAVHPGQQQSKIFDADDN
ncbi:MAG: hypothetical protein ACIWVG_26845 [Gloeotrichia echinulata HAB0833]